MKRVAIETSSDLSSMDLQNLMNILINYELSMTEPPPKLDKNKSVAL